MAELSNLSLNLKSFGLTFISDDYFLALVGSFSSIFNAAGRIFWGHMADKFSFQVSEKFQKYFIKLRILKY